MGAVVEPQPKQPRGRGVGAPVRHAHRTSRRSVPHATALVCRGCCCGTQRKHPDVDHDHQLAVLEACANQAVHVRSTGCLGPCADSNVVAVRLAGTTDRVWFGLVNTDDATDALATWIRSGCHLPVPPDLRTYQLGVPADAAT